MTPKEKADDFVRKFTKENRGNKTYNEKYCNGISLALICVDEMIGYEDFKILLENHLDVFGLIEKGLAIDINTIK